MYWKENFANFKWNDINLVSIEKTGKSSEDSKSFHKKTLF